MTKIRVTDGQVRITLRERTRATHDLESHKSALKDALTRVERTVVAVRQL